MDWSPYADRINSMIYRAEKVGHTGPMLTALVVIFGLTDEEHFDLDLHGMGEELEPAVMRVMAEMEAAGINLD
jgi:hypothetical protein